MHFQLYLSIFDPLFSENSKTSIYNAGISSSGKALSLSGFGYVEIPQF